MEWAGPTPKPIKNFKQQEKKMADYSGANVKVIINDLSAGADSVSGTLANDIKTFVATLSSNTIISADVVKLDASRVAYIILYT